ncbi:hypothetical protein T4E_10068 [Trichinella pseudospiralis]|uniref:Uncharacterized protein n=1 Tax=Trichinella pseudospiralis TaxID=6337 RepID=A0A0V0XJ43_TRIPS|nr:hypothetical protein T4E_10068 [Trichinella pseudospiralis]
MDYGGRPETDRCCSMVTWQCQFDKDNTSTAIRALCATTSRGQCFLRNRCNCGCDDGSLVTSNNGKKTLSTICWKD